MVIVLLTYNIIQPQMPIYQLFNHNQIYFQVLNMIMFLQHHLFSHYSSFLQINQNHIFLSHSHYLSIYYQALYHHELFIAYVNMIYPLLFVMKIFGSMKIIMICSFYIFIACMLKDHHSNNVIIPYKNVDDHEICCIILR